MVSPPTEPVQWYTLDQVAALCHRSPGTIRNLVSRYQLPRRRVWIVKNRLRKRTSFFSPPTVAYLQQITLHGDSPRSVHRPAR